MRFKRFALPLILIHVSRIGLVARLTGRSRAERANHALVALLAGVTAVCVLAVPAPSFANGRGVELTDQQLETIASRGSALGMDEAAVARVTERLRAGQLPDSSRKGASPVSTVIERTGWTITETATYQDGSVTLISYPDFEAMASAVWAGDAQLATRSASATGCSYTYTSAAITWTNCKIDGVDVYVNMAYRLNATMVRGYSAKLTKVYDNQALGKLGSISHVRFGLVASSAAQYQVIWTSVGGWASFTRTLTTKISSGGALSVSLY